MSFKETSMLYHQYQLSLIELQRKIMIFQRNYDLKSIHFETKQMIGTVGVRVVCNSETNSLWLLEMTRCFEEEFDLKLIKNEIHKYILSEKTKVEYIYEYTFKDNKYYNQLNWKDIYE